VAVPTTPIAIATARLRETLRVFVHCGSSYKLAAEQLTLHFNTVRYRVTRAVTRRGRAIEADRLDVEVALLLVATGPRSSIRRYRAGLASVRSRRPQP
jgi:sugar diacid utilization regulator